MFVVIVKMCFSRFSGRSFFTGNILPVFSCEVNFHLKCHKKIFQQHIHFIIFVLFYEVKHLKKQLQNCDRVLKFEIRVVLVYMYK